MRREREREKKKFNEKRRGYIWPGANGDISCIYDTARCTPCEICLKLQQWKGGMEESPRFVTPPDEYFTNKQCIMFIHAPYFCINVRLRFAESPRPYALYELPPNCTLKCARFFFVRQCCIAIDSSSDRKHWFLSFFSKFGKRLVPFSREFRRCSLKIHKVAVNS